MKRLFPLLIACAAFAIPPALNPAFQGSKGASSAGPYTPNTAYFAGDGQCDIRHTGPFTGTVNALYFSFWLKPDATATTTAWIWGQNDDGIRVRLNGSDQVLITCEDAASTELINANSTAQITRDGNTWTHVFIRLDRAVDNQIQIYINGTETTTITTFLSTGEDADPIDVDGGTDVGSEFGGNHYEGCMADMWVSTGNTYANITIGDFYNAGDPVDLGATGTGPDGSQPRVFLRGSGTGFIVNSGAAVDFTKNGTTALTTCSTTP